MKRAEIYAKEVGVINNNDELEKRELLLLIREIQEATIRETVKECLNTCAYVNYPMEDDRRLCGEITTKESILSVADKLIKELC